jgi:branched-chain amino acid transport system ATP-binding protein
MITLDTVTIRFGGLVALDGVSATLTAPVVGIIGPNGAGKTTIMNILSGFLTATSGRVMLDGADLLRLPPHRRARMGLRRSFQREQIADDLTVLDNVLVQTDGTLTPFHVGLADRADRLGADLTGFERRLTDVARCMAGTPRLVMFDEPAGGMSVDETARLGDLILQIHPMTGAQTIVIDHDVSLIARICAETLVLDFGRRIAAGPTATVLADPAVKAAYLGVGA